MPYQAARDARHTQVWTQFKTDDPAWAVDYFPVWPGPAFYELPVVLVCPDAGTVTFILSWKGLHRATITPRTMTVAGACQWPLHAGQAACKGLQLQDDQAAGKEKAARDLYDYRQEATEIKENSDAEWEKKVIKEVDERRAKRSKTRSEDLDRMMLLKSRTLDQEVQDACQGHQARFDADVREHLAELRFQAFKS